MSNWTYLLSSSHKLTKEASGLSLGVPSSPTVRTIVAVEAVLVVTAMAEQGRIENKIRLNVRFLSLVYQYGASDAQTSS